MVDNTISLKDLALNVFYFLEKNKKLKFLWLVILITCSSLMEALSIGVVVPFLSVLIDPSIILVRADNYFIPIDLSDYSIDEIRSFLFLALILVFIFSGVFRLLVLRFQTRFGMEIGTDLCVTVYRNILYFRYDEIILKNSSEILAVLQKARDLVGYIVLPSLIVISSSFMAIFICFTLIIIEPLVASLSFLGVGFLYLLASRMYRPFLVENSKAYAGEMIASNKLIQEAIGGFRDIVIDGSQQIYVDEFQASISNMQSSAGSNAIMSQTPRLLIETLGILIISGVSFLMLKMGYVFASLVPTLGAMVLGAQRLLPLFNQLYAAFSSMRGGAQSVIEVLGYLPASVPIDAIDSGLPDPVVFNKSIRLEDVAFTYSADRQLVLKGVNGSIPRGSIIGVIGETGSGKSTLTDLIMGLLVPTGGRIVIDGSSLDQDNIAHWRASVSHVPQSVFLADSSILENIALGSNKADIAFDRVVEAAEVAQLSDVIESLPNGYFTVVGERGVRLSGGQRQRIGIARAVYKRSKLLVLDEATSSLDNATEDAVMNAIHSMGDQMTIVIIAHRLSTLKNCHEVWEIKDGLINRTLDYVEVLRSQLNIRE
jgi:ABC-type bacteriocin/lantibiotic exporter with double-glycine peptidase domain